MCLCVEGVNCGGCSKCEVGLQRFMRAYVNIDMFRDIDSGFSF